MPALLIRHRVTDYAAWRRGFDDQESIRWSNGCRGGQVYRKTGEPGEVVILLEWDDLHRARLYAQSDDLLESLRRAEVADVYDVWLLDGIDDGAG